MMHSVNAYSDVSVLGKLYVHTLCAHASFIHLNNLVWSSLNHLGIYTRSCQTGQREESLENAGDYLVGRGTK